MAKFVWSDSKFEEVSRRLDALEEDQRNQIFTNFQNTHLQIQKESSLEDLLYELNSLIGLNDVKKEVTSLINLLKVRQVRAQRGLQIQPLSMHLVFSGNPGTGKTTVARLLSKIYRHLGFLSKGHLIEVDRSGLVAGYVGHTALKVQNVLEEAKGGILFIDEAYALTVNRGENDFGYEAVDTLLKGMEDFRDDLIVIVAGYPDMMNIFLDSNPGLRSRFNRFIVFPDYTADELTAIFQNMCSSSGYVVTNDCLAYTREYFEKKVSQQHSSFANGREVRTYFETATVNQANRLANTLNSITDDTLSTLILDDVRLITL